jgi:hypothetical protein
MLEGLGDTAMMISTHVEVGGAPEPPHDALVGRIHPHRIGRACGGRLRLQQQKVSITDACGLTQLLAARAVCSCCCVCSLQK